MWLTEALIYIYKTESFVLCGKKFIVETCTDLLLNDCTYYLLLLSEQSL